MIQNPFTIIESRIDRIESLLEQVLAYQIQNTNPSLSDQQLLDVKEAAAFVKLAAPTIYSLVSRREIPHYKRNGKLYFCKDELREWLTEDKPKTRSEIRSGASRFLRSNKSRPGATA